MTKPRTIVLLACFLAGAAWPQENPPGDEAEPPAVAEPAAVEAEAAEEIDDSDLDEQTYEEDEDDFVPSEEIPTDVPIPFPSNI